MVEYVLEIARISPSEKWTDNYIYAERKVEKFKEGKKAFTIIAKRDGVSVRNVRTEIQRAIDAGMENPDPRV
jgi:hypothetical protein